VKISTFRSGFIGEEDWVGEDWGEEDAKDFFVKKSFAFPVSPVLLTKPNLY